jgi:hypothetical protein
VRLGGSGENARRRRAHRARPGPAAGARPRWRLAERRAGGARAGGLRFGASGFDRFGVGWIGSGWFGPGWLGGCWFGPGGFGSGWFGLGWFGPGWFGPGWFGVGWFGVGWFGPGWFGPGWFGPGWFGPGWSGLSRRRPGRHGPGRIELGRPGARPGELRRDARLRLCRFPLALASDAAGQVLPGWRSPATPGCPVRSSAWSGAGRRSGGLTWTDIAAIGAVRVRVGAGGWLVRGLRLGGAAWARLWWPLRTVTAPIGAVGSALAGMAAFGGAGRRVGGVGAAG